MDYVCAIEAKITQTFFSFLNYVKLKNTQKITFCDFLWKKNEKKNLILKMLATMKYKCS